MNIVGISGWPRSGKDLLAELFMDNGYFGVSLGDIVRDEARIRNANEPDPISVKNTTKTANYLRSVHGADFALKEAIKMFDKAKANQEYKGLVVFSVRAPVEADFIINNGGRLIWVEASDVVRYQRSVSARRKGEKEESFDEMLETERLQEKPQPGMPAEVQMNMTYIKQKSTEIFENNGNDIEAFKINAQKSFGLNYT